MDNNQEFEIAITAPDISAYRMGNTGIDYFHSFDSGRPGPHVCLTALVHGNEYCGAIALDWLFAKNITPRQGKLTLGFVNIGAFESFDVADPAASRFIDEDFNRLWSADVLDGSRDSLELKRAREIRPLMDTVDVLLDIHSMQRYSPPLMMCGPLEKGQSLGQSIASTAYCITDSGHVAGKRMRDYSRFIDASTRNAVLVECGQHWESSSVVVAKKTIARFLTHVQVCDEGLFAAESDYLKAETPLIVEVTGPYTVKNEAFTFTQPYSGMEVIAKAGTVIGHDGDEAVVTPYDNCVLIMPSMRLQRGQSAVRLGRLVC